MTVRSLTLSVSAAALLIATSFHAAWAYDDGVNVVAANIAYDVGTIPKLVHLMAYVLGAFFAVSGLLKLKDWIHESDKAGLNPALIRLVVSALLVAFPHMMRITMNSWFGKGYDNGVGVQVPAPKLNAFGRRK